MVESLAKEDNEELRFFVAIFPLELPIDKKEQKKSA
jgi:hypothetical protein